MIKVQMLKTVLVRRGIMIKIMVDSTCDLPESIIKTYDIRVLLKISLKEEYRTKRCTS